jgi:outer membrane protein assembly factor BamB
MIQRMTFFGVALSAALLVPPLAAQTHRRTIFSTPAVPSDEALRRLNLHLAWRAAVPVDGTRDGIITAEPHGKDLIVLTRSGMVVRLDAETGRTYWRARVGKPYTLAPYLAVNSRSVYVFANAVLFALDRETGGEKWSRPMPAGLAAGAAVDEEYIFIPTVDTRLSALYLPFVTVGGGAGSAGSPGERPRVSAVYVRPDAGEPITARPVWSDVTNIQIAFAPLQSADEVLVLSRDGEGMGYPKVPREAGSSSVELYHFNLDGKIAVPGGEFGDTAYIGSDDASVYAINMRNGKLRWRHTAGTAITRKPVALEYDLYATSVREGLVRLDRATGDALWKVPAGRRLLEANEEADRFLAANDRFVYATDHSGRLLVLDRKRGTRLSMLDTTGFRVPIVNDTTDRLYLGANDGLIVCLHDRDQREPLRHRKSLEDLVSPVLKRLAQPVNERGGVDMTMREALVDLRKKYGLHFVTVMRAFKDADLPNPEERVVKIPRTDGKPLKDHLQRILSQANATYQVTDQTIFVIPAREKEKAKEGERPPEKEPEKEPEKAPEKKGKGIEKGKEGKKEVEGGKEKKEIEADKEKKEIEKGKDKKEIEGGKKEIEKGKDKKEIEGDKKGKDM